MSPGGKKRDRRDRGGPVYLRLLTDDDFSERYLSWFRDTEVTRFLDAGNISRADAIDHLRRGESGKQWSIYAICETLGDRHIGNLKIGPIEWQNMVSDMVTVIGERDAWGNGYAREAICIGVDIAFGEMNLRKLSAKIDSRNLASLKAYGAAGFKVEAALKDHLMHRSTGIPLFSDKVYVACFNPAFDAAKAMAR